MLTRVVAVVAIGLALGLGMALLADRSATVPAVTAPAPAFAGTVPAAKSATGVVRAVSNGTVLAADGQIWVFRPDQDRWMTIDQAFKEEGRETHVVPLPTPVDQIKEMTSFGFFLTHGGEVWFYEMSTDKWRKLPSPA